MTCNIVYTVFIAAITTATQKPFMTNDNLPPNITEREIDDQFGEENEDQTSPYEEDRIPEED